uniref:EF-hand domain-containing protein n=1 Tax=Strombidium inclinatum TaxID=197538 RepID=A0A7S3IWQ0_9SPIT|mmetsp:Transcript_5959/g.9694  ORF Transcript_5959/g.9694 Transcript_5959/m.9694 type:complete len:189 (+) Transcript_5959:20-586(+)
MSVQEIILKVKEQMAERGARTVRGLGRVFNAVGASPCRKVEVQEFFVGLNECGVKLTKEETNVLLSHFDTEQDGHVNFDEFLTAIRGRMCPARQEVVDIVFSKFNADGSDKVTASDLRVCYSVEAHPKVVSGEITEDEAFLEFLANFGDKNNDGKITKTEWDDFYAAVSSAIDNDDHFVQLMKQAWKL